jgi:hypothetical protein
MSSLSKKTKSSQNATSTSALTDWSKNQFDAGQERIRGVVDNYTSQPFKKFEGPLVAGLSGDEQMASQMARDSVGRNNGLFSEAGDLIRQGANTDISATQVAGPAAVTATQVDGPDAISATQVDGPREVNARLFDENRVRSRYNPYEKDVVDAVGTYMEEDLTKRINNNQLRAASSGAYGGSRHGVADAELMRTTATDKAAQMADLRYRGYNDAVMGDERESIRVDNNNRTNSDNDYASRRDNALRFDTASERNSDVGYASRRDNALRLDSANERNSDVDYSSRRDNALRADNAAASNRDNKYQAAGLFTGMAGQQTAELNNTIDLLRSTGADARKIEQAKMLAEKAQYDEQYADEWRKYQSKLQAEVGLFGSTPMLTTNNSSGSSTSKTSDPMGEASAMLKLGGSAAKMFFGG